MLLEDFAKAASRLEELGRQCQSTESIAMDAINYLYNQIGGATDCALIRFFRTMPYAELPPELQEKAQKSVGAIPRDGANFLTLLATRGAEPEWNDRFASEGHQVIPLFSDEMLERAPMIQQLIQRIGVDSSKVKSTTPSAFLLPGKKNYNVMFLPDTSIKHEFIQAEFVQEAGLKSVIGFGSVLPTGDMFAIVMFMRKVVSEEDAAKCKLLAQAIEKAVNRIRSGTRIEARILLATTPEEAARFRALFRDDYSISTAETVGQAMSLINERHFDLVICGIAFDDSRMFELLKEFKAQTQGRAKPFICLSQFENKLTGNLSNQVKSAAGVLGASAFIDALHMSDDELLSTLQAYLPEQVWN